MEEQATKPADTLERIVDLANQLIQATKKVAELTEALGKAKEFQGQIEREDLPELLRELALTSVTLKNGMVVELKDEFDCGITKANHKAALKWLDDHEFGSIIKTKVQVEFARDDRANALELSTGVRKFIKTHRLDTDCELVESVHPSTLKSFIKEEMSKGTNVPRDLFSIHPYSKAKLTQK